MCWFQQRARSLTRDMRPFRGDVWPREYRQQPVLAIGPLRAAAASVGTDIRSSHVPAPGDRRRVPGGPAPQRGMVGPPRGVAAMAPLTGRSATECRAPARRDPCQPWSPIRARFRPRRPADDRARQRHGHPRPHGGCPRRDPQSPGELLRPGLGGRDRSHGEGGERRADRLLESHQQPVRRHRLPGQQVAPEHSRRARLPESLCAAGGPRARRDRDPGDDDPGHGGGVRRGRRQVRRHHLRRLQGGGRRGSRARAPDPAPRPARTGCGSSARTAWASCAPRRA